MFNQFKTLQELKLYYDAANPSEQDELKKYLLVHKPILNSLIDFSLSIPEENILEQFQILHFFGYDFFNHVYCQNLSNSLLCNLLEHYALNLKNWLKICSSLENFKTVLTYFNFSIFDKIEYRSLYFYVSSPEILLYLKDEGLDPNLYIFDLLDYPMDQYYTRKSQKRKILTLKPYIILEDIKEEDLLHFLENVLIGSIQIMEFIWEVVLYNDYFSFNLMTELFDQTFKVEDGKLKDGELDTILNQEKIKQYFKEHLTAEVFEDYLRADPAKVSKEFIFEVYRLYGYENLSLEQWKEFIIKFGIDNYHVIKYMLRKLENKVILENLKFLMRERILAYCHEKQLENICQMIEFDDRKGLVKLKDYYRTYKEYEKFGKEEKAELNRMCGTENLNNIGFVFKNIRCYLLFK